MLFRPAVAGFTLSFEDMEMWFASGLVTRFHCHGGTYFLKDEDKSIMEEDNSTVCTGVDSKKYH